MRFRFTLTHLGSENSPFTVPPLSQWDTQTGADTEWSPGPSPNVTLPGVTFGGDDSEYLYVDYAFEADIVYSITAAYTKTYLSGVLNPRTMYLRVLDSSFAVLFSESETTPPSPGGTGSVTLEFTATAACDKIAIKASDGAEVTIVINSVTGTSVDPNDVTTSLEINEPDGWKESTIKLARDKDFRSLVEFFEGSFIFYGNNGVVNGGIDYIRNLELIYGPDVSIGMLIELTLDDYTWDEVFSGQLDLSLAEELMDNKFRIPIIRDNFWAKFMNRRDTPVDLQAATDLDLIAIPEAVEGITLYLPGQPINYYGEYNASYSKTYDAVIVDPGLGVNPSDLPSLILAWDNVITDDLKIFTLVRGTTTHEAARIIGIFEAPYDGEYTIEVDFTMSIYEELLDVWTHVQVLDGFDIYPALNVYRTNNPTRLAEYEYPGSPEVTLLDDSTDSGFRFDVTQVITLARGEQIAITLEWLNNPSSEQIALNATIFGIVPLDWKTDCAVATTEAITLSGEQTIDGVLTSGDRVLVRAQGNLWENGIYVSSAGAWSRSSDMDTADEFLNAAVYITGGDFQSDTAFRQTDIVATVGVDAVKFELADPSDERTKPFPFEVENNFLKITGKTTFRDTQQPAFLMHDVGAAILKSYGLGETNPFYSEVMGSSLTNARQYDQDGCIWNHAIIRGLQLRGYTLAAKPFFTSFNEWWKGCNPIFNLGLTYETIGGEIIDPDESAIQAPTAWIDGSGTFPGTWNYSVFGYPFVSINGNGGPSGYTCGTMATVGGQTYVISTAISIFETGGVNPLSITFIWAILDASFEEIETQSFTYTTYGLHAEVFNITPLSDGTYFGVRAINDTPFDTKSIVVRMAEGATAIQLLSNEDFDDASVWVNAGSGTSWVIGGGEAVITMATGASTEMVQDNFTGGLIGEYHFISEYMVTGVSGGDTVDLLVNFYDAGDVLVSTKTDLLFNNDGKPFHHVFTSLVIVNRIDIKATITAGSDIEITIPYASLFVIAPTEITVVPEERIIRVEEVEHFYDPEFVIELSNIRDISRKYDNDKIYNKINIGYTTWKSEDVSGIDDPQTQHIHSTRFEKIGSTLTLWSDWIAASLAIEKTRRETIAESTDYKFDDSVFIIAIQADDVSPDVYTPELDENFSSVENLLNSDRRYNISLSVARNFLRWRNWFNGCLQNFLNSYYKFVRGEGNFDMISTMIEGSPGCLEEDYDGNPLSEKQDIEVTDDIIHLPNYYELEVPLSWEDYKTIRENRKKAIGISMTDEDHVPLFIDELDYNIMHARAKITGWTNVFMELTVIEDNVADQICMIPEGECANPITDEFGVVLTDENGVCIEFV